jgi:hypothetical protein
VPSARVGAKSEFLLSIGAPPHGAVRKWKGRGGPVRSGFSAAKPSRAYNNLAWVTPPEHPSLDLRHGAFGRRQREERGEAAIGFALRDRQAGFGSVGQFSPQWHMRVTFPERASLCSNRSVNF